MSNNKVLFWSFTVALGGFLFGFDTAVISGGEQTIQKLWSLSDTMIGQMVAMALYGTVIGALIGGIPADKLGRKVTLFWIALLYLISAIGSALAPEIYSLMFFRFIGGLGVGVSSVVAPWFENSDLRVQIINLASVTTVANHQRSLQIYWSART